MNAPRRNLKDRQQRQPSRFQPVRGEISLRPHLPGGDPLTGRNAKFLYLPRLQKQPDRHMQTHRSRADLSRMKNTARNWTNWLNNVRAVRKFICYYGMDVTVRALAPAVPHSRSTNCSTATSIHREFWSVRPLQTLPALIAAIESFTRAERSLVSMTEAVREHLALMQDREEVPPAKRMVPRPGQTRTPHLRRALHQTLSLPGAGCNASGFWPPRHAGR